MHTSSEIARREGVSRQAIDARLKRAELDAAGVPAPNEKIVVIDGIVGTYREHARRLGASHRSIIRWSKTGRSGAAYQRGLTPENPGTCPRCGEPRTPETCRPSKRTSSGLACWCVACKKAYEKEYRTT